MAAKAPVTAPFLPGAAVEKIKTVGWNRGERQTGRRRGTMLLNMRLSDTCEEGERKERKA